MGEHALPEGLELLRDERGLALVADGVELRGDFSRMLPRLRPDRLSRELLVRAAEALCRATSAMDLAVAANEVRTAATEIGRIVGKTYSDDLLDALFSRFCVGK